MSKFDPKSSKGSVPNGQSKFPNWYAIRWFKLKLKPPKIMKNTYFESMLSIAFVDKPMVCFIEAIFRWFKFTLKPPNSIASEKFRLAIWDTSFWNFLVKFGHNGP